ncbi:MAG TPA: hypothetical protein VJ878_01655 [Candidatus Izemoplasmatales bacterium]|nr:hypothetical protein [Candidatus Izemoplasmatales bacterium]
MEDTIEKRIMKQFKRYPRMELEDFIKYIYQNSFGPKHMTANPTVDALIAYIEDELSRHQPNAEDKYFQAIGNDYYRVSLSVIESGLMDVKNLAVTFYNSMLDSPVMDETAIALFTHQLNIIRYLIETKALPYEVNESKDFIEAYLDSGIRPLHHRETYRMIYHPHYRVIHKRHIKNYIEVKK